MDLLSAATACLLFIVPQGDCDASKPARALATHARAADRIAQWDGIIAEAAHRFVVPADWIRSVMGVESGGRVMLNGQPITSSKGAMGLMQLMPETWQDMRQRYGLGDDPYNPRDNILAGTAYLRSLLDRFGIGAFAAYNVGPGRFKAYLDGIQSLPAETQKYLTMIESRVPEAGISVPRPRLFFENSTASKSANSSVVTTVAAHDLFVPLSGGTP